MSPFPAKATIPQIAALCGILHNQVRDRLKASGLPHTGDVNLQKSVAAIVKTLSKPGADTKEKLAVIELQNAEVQQLSGLDKLCLLDDARLYVAEERIAVRQAIERSDDLSETQKKRILTKLQAIKSKPPEPFKS